MQIKKGFRLLAFVLATLILSSCIPIQVFAKEDLAEIEEQLLEIENQELVDEEPIELKADKEEYDSYNLEELKFYIGDEEVNMEENFFQDTYGYTLNLPRETREIKVKAIPVTKSAKVKVYNGSGDGYDIEGPDYTTTITFKETGGLGDFICGMTRNVGITVTPNNPPEVSWKPRYTIKVNIAGYPEPKIRGTKRQFVFEQHQEVTKEELLEGVTAIDELDGDITDKIEIIPYEPKWYGGKLDTRFLVEDGMIRYHVENSHGRVANADIPLKIVKEKPADLDTTPPEFHGVEPKTFYVGETVDKAKLLEGIIAIDDIDGDITEKIEVTPDSINTDEPRDHYVTYTVEDKAGNKAQKKVKHTVAEKPVEQSDKEKRIREIIKSIAPNYYGTGEDWEAIDLAIYGKENLIHKETLLTKAQQVIKKSPEKATEYERITVSLTAAGLDARKIPVGDGTNINLIEKVANHDNMGTLNDYIWALLAYDSGNYPVSKDNRWTREALIKYILKHQLSDGSWSLDNKLGSQLDVDITAMTISALAPYRTEPEVEEALEKAVNALGRVKTKDYCFIYGPQNAETSESTSMVLIALASMGIDPNIDPRFSGSTKSVIDGQLSFVMERNLFKHVKVFVDGYTPSPNPIATEQGFRALVTYVNSQENGYKPYHVYQFSDYSGNDGQKPGTGNPGDIVTLKELNILQIPYKTKYKVGDKTELDGLKVEAVYSNGKRKIVPNSELSLYDFNTNTSGYKNVLVQYGGLTASFAITVEDTTLTEKVTANISVVDPKGKTYFPAKDLKIKEGKDTAFSLLQKTGLSYEYNYHPKYEGVYVSSIGGLAEFDGGPGSGWMYRVNGVFPSFSSSLYKLKKGDQVEWLYTRDLGRDLGFSFGGDLGENKKEEGKKEVTYCITSWASKGGKVNPNGKMTIKEKEEVTINIIPDEGYEIEKVLINGKNQGAIISYTFKDVKKDQKLEAYFIPAKSTNPTNPTKPTKPTKSAGFTDIKGHWAKTAIDYVIHKEYFEGTSEKKFSPNRPITRAEFITVLGRRANVDLKNYPGQKLKDIKKDAYYTGYVNWAVEKGIIKGYKDGSFRPNKEISREEMAVMLNRYMKVTKEDKPKIYTVNYSDKKFIANWAKEDIYNLTKMGLLEGKGRNKFAPKANLNRAEAAQILYNLDTK